MTALLVVLLSIAAVLGGLHLLTRRIAAQAEAAIPPVGTFTEVPGGRIHWTEQGEGPPLLCIHGLGGALQNYTYALAPLLARDFRVIVVDRPGCGHSERRGPEAATLPEQARMIAAFLDAIGVETAAVVGHSLGGAVALQLARQHPGKVRALALLCPLTQPLDAPPAPFRGLAVATPWLRRLLARTLAVPMARRMGEATLRAVFAPEPVPDDFLVRGGGALGLRPKGFLGASEDLVAVPAAAAALAARHREPIAPGGILYGAEDAVLDPERQGRASAEALPGFVYETLPGRGHMIPFTAPEAAADFVRRMAARADAA